MRLLFFLSIFVLSPHVESSKILGIFWTHSRSHHILGSALCQELARRGHNVTYMSPFIDDVNIDGFEQKQLFGIIGSLNSFLVPNSTFWRAITSFPRLAVDNSKKFWKNEAVQNLIKKPEKFDVIIMFSIFNDAMLALGPHLNAPVIVFTANGANLLVNKYVGNPNLPYSINLYQSEGTPESFRGRITSLGCNILLKVIEQMIIRPVQESILSEYLPESPTLSELEKSVSLVFVNSHHSIEQPRPYVPNMVQIGGFYARKTKKLPSEIETFLDSAKHGAVLFSFGTNMKIANLDKEKFGIIVKALGKLHPIKVLLKSEIDLDGVPDNILVKKWLPQNDILAHENLKAFVSHGGLGSTTEAVYHGKPFIGIPLFNDQRTNMAVASKCGYAIKLLFSDISQDKLDEALWDILNNQTYKEVAKQRSSLLRKQPMDPMDKAIWWVEHIIEFKGGQHLRNVAMDLEWYELYMVDIVLFVAFTILISMLIAIITAIFIFKKISRVIVKTKESKVKKS